MLQSGSRFRRWSCDTFAKFGGARALVGKPFTVHIIGLRRLASKFFLSYLHIELLRDEKPRRDGYQQHPGHPARIEGHFDNPVGHSLIEPEKNDNSPERFRN